MIEEMDEELKYIEPEIPPAFKMHRAIEGKSDDLVETYEAWRVLRVEADTGEVISICKSNGNEDYKTKRNAQKQAAIYNKYWARNDPNVVYVARKCKITIEPVD